MTNMRYASKREREKEGAQQFYINTCLNRKCQREKKEEEERVKPMIKQEDKIMKERNEEDIGMAKTIKETITPIQEKGETVKEASRNVKASIGRILSKNVSKQTLQKIYRSVQGI